MRRVGGRVCAGVCCVYLRRKTFARCRAQPAELCLSQQHKPHTFRFYRRRVCCNTRHGLQKNSNTAVLHTLPDG